MRDWFSLLGSSKQISLLKAGRETVATLERLLQDFAGGFVQANLIGAASVLRCALTCLQGRNRSTSRKHSEAEARIDEAAGWMGQHVKEVCSLARIAQNAGLSVPHFTALFRARMGTSPAHYFQRLKIQRACHLLDTTTLTVKAIADQVAFADPYYFSRIFRKMMGISPRDYRKIEKI